MIIGHQVVSHDPVLCPSYHSSCDAGSLDTLQVQILRGPKGMKNVPYAILGPALGCIPKLSDACWA